MSQPGFVALAGRLNELDASILAHKDFTAIREFIDEGSDTQAILEEIFQRLADGWSLE